jgi:hypothetical protein
MRKILLIIFLCISSAYFCNAQVKDSDDINTVKIAYITNQLNLTPTEAQQFWPIYNRYFGEVKKAHQDNPDDVVVFGEKLVNIRKKYKPEFKNVLGTDDRANKVYVAEAKFVDLLKNELNNRQNKKP